MVSEWLITDFIMVDFDEFGNLLTVVKSLIPMVTGVNGSPLANHSSTVAVAESGPRCLVVASQE